MKEETFSNSIARRTSNRYKRRKSVSSEYYCHPTFLVNNISEYIELISIISKANETISEGDTVVFRGVPDETFELIPGLARIKYTYGDTEEKIISEFITRRPDAFSNLSDFDMIAKMQHYGLPTRLLDFSTNPLVALFFACETIPGKNGRVICNNAFVENDNSPFVRTICNAVIKKQFDCDYLETYLSDEKITVEKYLRRFYQYQDTTVIRPKYWNQRIANQGGVFMLFPNAIVDRYRTILLYSSELGIEEAIKQYGRGPIEKERIEKALSFEPVEYYRTMDNSIVTEESFQKLTESYCDREELSDIMHNRFIVTWRINSIRSSKIKHNCCSIIIEGKNKKKILKELSFLGIGMDYIYPELEYTAQEIKKNMNLSKYDFVELMLF